MPKFMVRAEVAFSFIEEAEDAVSAQRQVEDWIDAVDELEYILDDFTIYNAVEVRS
jgi:hypothetical protein